MPSENYDTEKFVEDFIRRRKALLAEKADYKEIAFGPVVLGDPDEVWKRVTQRSITGDTVQESVELISTTGLFIVTKVKKIGESKVLYAYMLQEAYGGKGLYDTRKGGHYFEYVENEDDVSAHFGKTKPTSL